MADVSCKCPVPTPIRHLYIEAVTADMHEACLSCHRGTSVALWLPSGLSHFTYYSLFGISLCTLPRMPLLCKFCILARTSASAQLVLLTDRPEWPAPASSNTRPSASPSTSPGASPPEMRAGQAEGSESGYAASLEAELRAARAATAAAEARAASLEALLNEQVAAAESVTLYLCTFDREGSAGGGGARRSPRGTAERAGDSCPATSVSVQSTTRLSLDSQVNTLRSHSGC